MIIKIVILAIIQGAAELLPVSSSGHVIVAEKLLGIDPTKPEMTLLLVMLHTGTMFATIVFYWKSWQTNFFSSWPNAIKFFQTAISATVCTGIVGLSLKFVIEKILSKSTPNAEIEMLFGNLKLISISLAIVGIFIIYAGYQKCQQPNKDQPIDLKGSCLIGIIQGICLPFRGFSRSGATISAGLILGFPRKQVEAFSFALAVIMTPPIIVHEFLRLTHSHKSGLISESTIFELCLPSLVGMVLSFGTGLLALRWLSAWLQNGRWYLFGFYCSCASLFVLALSFTNI
jgi:undecaprenyl-diphosphatase